MNDPVKAAMEKYRVPRWLAQDIVQAEAGGDVFVGGKPRKGEGDSGTADAEPGNIRRVSNGAQRLTAEKE